jgi:uncharacterized protein (AIM24 family)
LPDPPLPRAEQQGGRQLHDQLLGVTQPVLSISLEPGESIVAEPGGFSWMTDSIQMSADADGEFTDELRHTLASCPGLGVYTARRAVGTIAFASKTPGSIVGIQLTPGSEYLVHRRGFLAGTPGIEVTTGFSQRLPAVGGQAEEFVLYRISGRGRAWVELSGDVVQRELAAGSSLRTHPWHIGMCAGSVAVQLTEVREDADGELERVDHVAVVSGPGPVWLQPKLPVAGRSAR